jgi:dienelactone hydrolase
MKKLAIVIAALVVVAVVGWNLIGGSEGVVAAALPEFPDYPAPAERLTDERSGEIYFASSSPFDLDVILAAPKLATPTTGLGTLFVPSEATVDVPVPAMVVLHGSGGISPGREMEYGKFLSQNGIAALVVNYYEPRGVTRETNYLLRVISVTEFDVIADAYASLRLLGSHPVIDGDRIGVVGFSYGGMAARFAMDERIREVFSPDHPGFAAFVDYYGPCFQNLGTKATNGAALLTLRGTEDASNDLAACEKRENELRALGVSVEPHVYEGAGHAWDSYTERRMFEDSPYVAGCEVRYDESGRSSVAGTPIVNVPPETSRAERIAIRMESGGSMADCVKSGYVIGRDDETRAKTDAVLLDFLAREL